MAPGFSFTVPLYLTSCDLHVAGNVVADAGVT